jgi:Methyltransferase domain
MALRFFRWTPTTGEGSARLPRRERHPFAQQVAHRDRSGDSELDLDRAFNLLHAHERDLRRRLLMPGTTSAPTPRSDRSPRSATCSTARGSAPGAGRAAARRRSPGTLGFPVERVGRDGFVMGVDRSPQVLALAAERSASHVNVAFDEADATALPVNDADFDAALCVQVLEYVTEVEAALAELHPARCGRAAASSSGTAALRIRRSRGTRPSARSNRLLQRRRGRVRIRGAGALAGHVRRRRAPDHRGVRRRQRPASGRGACSLGGGPA